MLNNLSYEYDDFAITGMWSTILTQRSIHRPHTHSNNMWSGVYYVQSDKDANARIHFYDPRPQVFNFEWYPEEAEKGKVVFFPGWLEHEMPPHDEDEYRITMPFNMAIGE